MWALILLAVCLRSVEACGKAGEGCCEAEFCEDVDHICEAGVCTLARPGEGICAAKGMLGQPCCTRACKGDNVTCAEGTCVDVNEEPVFDQSGPLPGTPGGLCIGDDQLCDEDDDVVLECIDRVCVEQSIVSDQFVRSPCLFAAYGYDSP